LRIREEVSLMDVIDKINSFVGADWSFDDFNIDYERVSIKLSYASDSTSREDIFTTIYCNNFIGFSFVGHWDENIIEYIKVESEGDLIKNSLQEIKRLYGEPPIPLLGGGVKKVDSPWYQLNIKLIDGNVIKVVCDSFSMEI
jgi:hypothetical protein